MGFKEWLQKENITSTSCIAGFARPIMAVVQRKLLIGFSDLDKPKKKGKKKKKKKSD
jgi:hypothetical protein